MLGRASACIELKATIAPAIIIAPASPVAPQRHHVRLSKLREASACPMAALF